MRIDPKAFLANAAVLAATLAILYVVGSIVLVLWPSFSPMLLRTVPVQLRVLGQTSKAERIPQDYVALLGDSYAEGVGDWLASRDPSGRYHSAHVINDLTGRDVVSFGRGGAGSAEALTRLPHRALGTGWCAWWFGVPEPSEIFIYVYEGNDITHDSRLVRRRIDGFDGSPASIARLDAFLYDFAIHPGPHCATFLRRFVSTLVTFASYSLPFLSGSEDASGTAAESRPNGHIIVAGRSVAVPEMLQGPPVTLGEEGLARAAILFDRSLTWLVNRFPSVPITVVYLPSPASVYSFVESAIAVDDDHEPGTTVSVERLREVSDAGCALIQAEARANGARFLDSRPALRAAARDVLVHGPLDWGHFNKAGYTTLGEFVAKHVGAQGGDVDCSAGTTVSPG